VRPGQLVLAVGRVAVDAALSEAQHKATLEKQQAAADKQKQQVTAAAAAAAGEGGGGGEGIANPLLSTVPAATTVTAAAAVTVTPRFECASVQECVALLKEAPFPKTPVLLRNMDAYLSLKELASSSSSSSSSS
jgi:hypothetical protein